MSNNNIPILSYGPRSFTKQEVIELADVAKYHSAQAIITQAFNLELLNFEDFKNAKKSWVTEATLLQWRSEGATLALLPKIKKYVPEIQSTTSTVSKQVTDSHQTAMKLAVALPNAQVYGKWEFEPISKTLQRGNYRVVLSEQQSAVVLELFVAQGSFVCSKTLESVVVQDAKRDYTPKHLAERTKILLQKIRHHLRDKLGIDFNPIERTEAGYRLVK